jgi:uncharacterized membrane protein
MVKTIGNPLSWTAEALSATGEAVASATERLAGSRKAAPPVVQTLHVDDLRAALKAGWEDFLALRSDVMFMVLLYPLIGLALALAAFNANFAPYLFPLASGFALIGPVAAVGLYELSRRREAGESPGFSDALSLLRAPALAPIVVLGIYLTMVFIVWMMAANLVYALTLGTEPYATTGAFVADVFGTAAGWQMIFFGTLVGFFFAAVVLASAMVSFPMLVDRDIGLADAVVTSWQVARRNPRVTAIWGAIVAALLVAGSIPLFLGLIVVFPVLGHATWHLYRRAVH